MVEGEGDCQILFEVGLYRRAHHLRALSFINGYLAMPQLLQRSPWPFTVSNRLQRSSSAISSLIQSYRPQINTMDLSSIERIAQSSENRVERQIIDELKEQKSKIRIGIERELKEREREGSRSKERNTFREGSKQTSRNQVSSRQETSRTPDRRPKNRNIGSISPHQQSSSRQLHPQVSSR